MTRAFIVNRRAAILRVLLYLAITFTLGFAAGRVSAAPRSASNVIPATLATAGESDSSGLTGALYDRRFDAELASAPRIARKEVTSTSKPAVRIRLPLAAGSLRGTASWYAANGLIAAVHSWRWGNRPYTVRVCATEKLSTMQGSQCVSVWVSDFCQACTGARLIDLSDDAFRLLAPLGQGIVKVTVTR